MSIPLISLYDYFVRGAPITGRRHCPVVRHYGQFSALHGARWQMSEARGVTDDFNIAVRIRVRIRIRIRIMSSGRAVSI